MRCLILFNLILTSEIGNLSVEHFDWILDFAWNNYFSVYPLILVGVTGI